MNKIVTSKEEILKVSRALIKEEGWSAINIRTVANRGNISIGSVYNYFESKADLVSETVESIWHDIFHSSSEVPVFEDFITALDYLVNSLERGNEIYPGFFNLHAMSFSEAEKANGKSLMINAKNHIKENLLKVLRNDSNIKKDAFNSSFTEEHLIQIVFSYIFFSLKQRDFDISPLKEMIRKLIY